MAGILKRIEEFGLEMNVKEIVADAKGFCLKCMVEAGMSPTNILAMADARAMRETGFLKCLKEGGVSHRDIYTSGKYVNAAALREAGFEFSDYVATRMDDAPRFLKFADDSDDEDSEIECVNYNAAVSYTHLTLPTKRIV